jgi:hypothetical protein
MIADLSEFDCYLLPQSRFRVCEATHLRRVDAGGRQVLERLYQPSPPLDGGVLVGSTADKKSLDQPTQYGDNRAYWESI